MSKFLGFRATLRLRFCGVPTVFNTRLSPVFRVSSRTLMPYPSDKLQDNLRKKDRIPDDFKIVYRTKDFYNWVKVAHDSCPILFALWLLPICEEYFGSGYDQEYPIPGPKDMVAFASYNELLIMQAALFLSIISIRYVTSIYVLRMYYNPNTNMYRAITCGNLPFTQTTTEILAGSVKRLTSTLPMPGKSTTFIANGKKFLLYEENFRTGSDYERLFNGTQGIYKS